MMKSNVISYHCVVWFLSLLAQMLSLLAFSGESYSPYIDQSYPASVYWGDTHLHTNLSLDAYEYNKNLGPDEAYNFSKGEVIQDNSGMEVRLRRPLDFLVIADHAFNMGTMQVIADGKFDLLAPGYDGKQQSLGSLIKANMNSRTFTESLWKNITSIADAHNDPGKFTAFIGYEWSALTPSSIHRVVVFKDGSDKASKVVPFSRFDSENPEDLWRFFENYEKNTKGEVLAIPHNGNLTDGHMFKLKDSFGNSFSQGYARSRSRWEPLIEVTQIKGDSETHPVLSPTDEFADFETWNSWSGRSLGYNYIQSKNGGWIKGTEKEWGKEMLKKKIYEYARSALKLGLQQQAELGVNPFKFGMIGSTDSHTSLSTADENNFWGKLGDMTPSKGRMMAPSGARSAGWQYSASGYAAVWARENTREALFAAMKRKEVYATTGPRITVRFFGGWGYDKEDALQPDLAKIGYSKGVPMGGDLTNPPKGMSPSFLIRAVRDPDGANLDRVQVIKGWRDKDGELHEKIYNIALSDDRKENRQGKVKPVGSTVDVVKASYTNRIGDPELAVVWQDPDFKKDELAFYYLRVLEIPTPRWTAYDAKFFGVKDIPDEVPMVQQERAYTTPIWYSPRAKAGGE